jgi:hypothetical protein
MEEAFDQSLTALVPGLVRQLGCIVLKKNNLSPEEGL